MARGPLRRLIVNADDFGLAEGVNRGILEAHAAGAVTSATVLVNAPGFEDAVLRARDAPRLGIGLHLNLTQGRPVSPRDAIPSLCDRRTGQFHDWPALLARALTGRVATEHVARECSAQLERLRRTGLAITHLDAHHHAHIFPGILAPVVTAARRAGLAALRVPLEPVRSLTWRPRAALAQGCITLAYRAARRRVTLLRHPDHFRGFGLTGQPDFLRRLLDVLDRLKPGVTELMVHPGYWHDRLSGWGGLGHARRTELAALTSDAVRACVDRGTVELIHFGRL